MPVQCARNRDISSCSVEQKVQRVIFMPLQILELMEGKQMIIVGKCLRSIGQQALFSTLFLYLGNALLFIGSS